MHVNACSNSFVHIEGLLPNASPDWACMCNGIQILNESSTHWRHGLVCQQLGALTTQSTQLYDSMLLKASPAILSQDGPRVVLD